MADYKKPDFWSQRAQKEGYPARSVYKLEEMDKKFGLLTPPGRAVRGGGFRVLDLGAAPGSWSLYALRKFAVKKNAAPALSLTAVDLSPLSPRYGQDLFAGEHFFFIRGDITADETQAVIRSRGPYSLVLSDAAPATTGNRTLDTQRSLSLAEEVLGYAENCLSPGGNLALKLFQGGDAAELLKRLRAHFSSARSFKPEVCRSGSFEVYYVGLGKK
jgi:23S rRNA (uridine2552-2'-O)-methyltransferase